MSIERVPGLCMVVHLAESEAHFPDFNAARTWAARLPADAAAVRAIEPAQTPCWMAYCDEPACEHPEGDENDNPTHLPAATADEAEKQLSDLQRIAGGALLCTMCRAEAQEAS